MMIDEFILGPYVDWPWTVATFVLVVFLLQRGWRAMPFWQRAYVILAAMVLPSFQIAARILPRLIRCSEDSACFGGLIAFALLYGLILWWGILVGLVQVRMLVIGRISK